MYCPSRRKAVNTVRSSIEKAGRLYLQVFRQVDTTHSTAVHEGQGGMSGLLAQLQGRCVMQRQPNQLLPDSQVWSWVAVQDLQHIEATISLASWLCTQEEMWEEGRNELGNISLICATSAQV